MKCIQYKFENKQALRDLNRKFEQKPGCREFILIVRSSGVYKTKDACENSRMMIKYILYTLQ